jgi:hypothetical protein
VEPHEPVQNDPKKFMSDLPQVAYLFKSGMLTGEPGLDDSRLKLW